MKRSAVLLLVVMLMSSLAANAQYSRIKNIVSSNHNLSSTGSGTIKAVSNTQICYYCHTPHQQMNTTDPVVTRNNAGTMPLWNHYLSSKTYGVYSSPSFDALGTDIAEVGSASPEGSSAVVTNLCLSCHDGSVGINTLYKGQYTSSGRVSPDFGGGVNVAVYMPGDTQVGGGVNGLRDEHPVNFTYDAALAAKSVSLVVPQSESTGLGGTRLGFSPGAGNGNFLPLFAGKMQCGTCHDVHDGTSYRPFLRATTTGSALCLACHGK